MKKLEDFFDKLGDIYSDRDIEIIKKGYSVEYRKPVIRIRQLEKSLEELKNKNISITQIDFLKDAFIVENVREKDIWSLKNFKNGNIALQSLSSQVPAIFMELGKKEKILDLTAAPGGKTIQISDLSDNESDILAIEKNQIRYEKMLSNIKKLKVDNIKTIKIDALKIIDKYKQNSFNKVLIDAPCSGEGRFNFNKEKSYKYWNNEIVKRNFNLQKELVNVGISLLKKGGVFIYSTCTLSPEENEDIVEYILGFEGMRLNNIDLDFEFKRDGIKEYKDKKYSFDNTKIIRILPSELSEGFFVAKFKKY